MRPVRHALKHDVELVGDLPLAVVHLRGDGRAVHMGEGGDLLEGIPPDGHGVPGRDRDRPEDVRVLSGREPEAEIGDPPELGGAEADDRRQRGERDEPVVGTDDARIHADPREHRPPGVTAVLLYQLGQLTE